MKTREVLLLLFVVVVAKFFYSSYTYSPLSCWCIYPLPYCMFIFFFFSFSFHCISFNTIVPRMVMLLFWRCSSSWMSPQENNILEVCIAKYWSNFGSSHLKYSLEFHGIQANTNTNSACKLPRPFLSSSFFAPKLFLYFIYIYFVKFYTKSIFILFFKSNKRTYKSPPPFPSYSSLRSAPEWTEASLFGECNNNF